MEIHSWSEYLLESSVNTSVPERKFYEHVGVRTWVSYNFQVNGTTVTLVLKSFMQAQKQTELLLIWWQLCIEICMMTEVEGSSYL